MNYAKFYSKVIAIKEMSAGNESVGSMWLDTKSFDVNTPILEIMQWAEGCAGKLIITMDESSIDNSKF